MLFFFITSLLPAKQTPYVILISFDGFRWDYTMRGITPNIQRMIDNGVYASSLRPAFPTKTFPNHLSIITGMYPENHGIISNNFRDPETMEWYNMGRDTAKVKSKWYKGEAFWETAERNGIISASYFWPGSDLNDKSRNPTYYKKYDHDKPYRERIDTLFYWLQLSKEKRPHFISIYFHDTDSYGHDFGPDSPQINESIKRCDSLIEYLYSGLRKIGMSDSVNVIISSDHGMIEASNERTVNIDEILYGLDYFSSDHGPFMLIDPSDIDSAEIVKRLQSNADHYSFYTKRTIPEYFHFNNNKYIPGIILIAEEGWYLAKERDMKYRSEYGDKGEHGYDNNLINMHGVFIAEGPNFKSAYKTGTVWNIDIYPLLAKIFNVSPNPKIDGKLERIEFLLRQNDD